MNVSSTIAHVEVVENISGGEPASKSRHDYLVTKRGWIRSRLCMNDALCRFGLGQVPRSGQVTVGGGRGPGAVAVGSRQCGRVYHSVDQTYHHLPARYTGHRAGSPLA